MAAVSRFSIKIQTKSISLPSRSHPTTFELEELLNKMKITVAEASSAEEICTNLSQMTGLYKCMNDLLTLSTTQVLMSHGHNKRWVDELVDESVKFLDICGSIRDLLSEMKDHCRDLLCALRRTKGSDHLMIENSLMKHTKKVRKHVRRLTANVKQVDNVLSGGGGSKVVDGSDKHHLAAVIRDVIGVSEMTVLVFEWMLAFFSSSVSRPNRWSSVVSKLIHKKTVACTVDHCKEHGYESIDAGFRVLSKYGFSFSSEVGDVQIVQCRLDLERVGAQIESMDNGLECLFKFLVRTRVSLLNIVSQ